MLVSGIPGHGRAEGWGGAAGALRTLPVLPLAHRKSPKDHCRSGLKLPPLDCVSFCSPTGGVGWWPVAQLQRRKVKVRRGRPGCGDSWEVGVSGAATGCGAGRAETEAVPAQVREAQ